MFLFQEKLYKVEIEWALSDTERKIVGKRNLFLKAFFNLLKNAIEEMDEIQGRGKLELNIIIKMDRFI
ncbi:hypothetical protein [Peribacillus simplex]|uniref:hypothetical protein n=1 Tax=Peribacillus simplex TaxID=1478 RepID=UPI003D26EB76